MIMSWHRDPSGTQHRRQQQQQQKQPRRRDQHHVLAISVTLMLMSTHPPGPYAGPSSAPHAFAIQGKLKVRPRTHQWRLAPTPKARDDKELQPR